MTWTPPAPIELATARAVLTWIRTARAAGHGGPDWLPCEADIAKSALFERLRSGKAPLPEPPPLGLSCPWYALVEAEIDHFVGRVGDVDRAGIDTGTVHVLQNPYEVVERIGPDEAIVRDAHHRTSYRFRLWFDPAHAHPRWRGEPGGWFMRNATPPAQRP